MTEYAPHVIKNYDALATTPQRKDALDILEAGLRAVETKTALNEALKFHDNTLYIGDQSYILDHYKKVIVVGIGKAAIEAASVLEDLLGDRIDEGIVLDTRSGTFAKIKSLVGTHPLPSPQNMAAASQIRDLLKGLTTEDLIITIVSGGGSALLCQPYEMNCEELAKITQSLIEKGATIQEMNTVRKHLSEILGGQFAEMAYPATILGLIFSDIPNNDLSLVASGPTFLDKTTIADAAEILAKYDIAHTCALPNCNLKETTKDQKYFDNVYNHLISSNQNAAGAMYKKAKELGYKANIKSTELTGEAKVVGRELAQEIKDGEAIIATGETTVIVKVKGVGGRNQEVALGALEHLPAGALVLSCNSDGFDNTPLAGALADDAVASRAKTLGLSPTEVLEKNNAYMFFKDEIGSGIETGPTGVNVSDLMLALGKK